MREPELPQLIAAAAALVLRPPDAPALAAMAESSGIDLDPARARQDFYDTLCVPQSGRYIPPYAHVLAQGRVRNGDWWYFPPPRYDGGDGMASWYDAVGFDPMQLDVDPMIKGAHRPLDHIGFILAYLAGLVASGESGNTEIATANSIIAAFVAENLGAWLDRYCDLLAANESPYLQAVAAAVAEVVQAARSCYPATISEAASIDKSRVSSSRSGT
jgi:Nitrate reductase delta subunit